MVPGLIVLDDSQEDLTTSSANANGGEETNAKHSNAAKAANSEKATSKKWIGCFG